MSHGRRVLIRVRSCCGGALGEDVLGAQVVEAVEGDGVVIVLIGERMGGLLMQKD